MTINVIGGDNLVFELTSCEINDFLIELAKSKSGDMVKVYGRSSKFININKANIITIMFEVSRN